MGLRVSRAPVARPLAVRSGSQLLPSAAKSNNSSNNNWKRNQSTAVAARQPTMWIFGFNRGGGDGDQTQRPPAKTNTPDWIARARVFCGPKRRRHLLMRQAGNLLMLS